MNLKSWLIIPAILLVSCQSNKDSTALKFKDTGVIPNSLAESDTVYPKPGRYIGYVVNGEMSKKFPLLIDTLFVSTDEKQLIYQAVARINLGLLSSHEYISSYFPNVKFEFATKAFTFAKGSRFEIVDLEYASSGFKGTIIDKVAGFSGQFEVKQQVSMSGGNKVSENIFKTIPSQSVLTGSYQGTCNNDNTDIQIEAFRGWHQRDKTGHALAGYRTMGRLGKVDPVLCGGTTVCTKENFLAGEYNFYTGKVDLKSSRKTRVCQLGNNVLECDACKLVKSKNSSLYLTHKPYMSFPRQFSFVTKEDKTNKTLLSVNVPAIVSGEYYGYLHHESNDQYQLLAFNVDAKESSYAKNPVRLSTVATLYFGEGDSPEFIAYKFDDASFPKNSNYTILHGPGESFFAISEWRQKTVSGVWYSKNRGRIGTIELQKNIVPAIPETYSLFQPISGLYEGQGWVYEVSAVANISENSSDISPLKIFGWAKEKVADSRRRQIEGGSYDFFTGALAFGLDDGRRVVGNKDESGMDLYWPPRPRFGLEMTNHTLAGFQKLSEKKFKQALLKIK